MAIISQEAFLSSMANPDWPEPATKIHSSLEMALWHIFIIHETCEEGDLPGTHLVKFPHFSKRDARE